MQDQQATKHHNEKYKKEKKIPEEWNCKEDKR